MGRSFLDMMKDSQQMNLDRLFSDARQFLDTTSSLYQTHLDALSCPYLNKSWNEVTHPDMWRLFSGFWLPNKPFNGGEMVSLFDKTCASLGYSFQESFRPSKWTVREREQGAA